MAKTIKFNLILDGYPVRTLEGVQEHFSIEDMLEYFRNGLLERWLEVRDYVEELEAVKDIDPEADDDEVVKTLIQIFDIAINNEDVEKGIEILTYLKRARELNAEYKKDAFEKHQVIEAYHAGYEATVQHMIDNKDNMALLKADVLEIEREYLGLFGLNHYELYFTLEEQAPQAIFAFLTRDAFRKYWIDEGSNPKILGSIKRQLLPVDTMKSILGENLKVVTRNTQAMWDPIERPEVNLMLLRIQPGTFVKNAGEFAEKLSADDVNEKFLRLKGLEYQCNIETYELLYMEV